jgi:recombination protein RecA
MAAVQKQGGTVCLVDAEMAFDPAWATTMGVDTTKLLLVQPDSGEAGLTAVDKLCASNAVQLIVVDSIAALVPEKEIEGEMTDQHMGLQARMMSQALRKLTHSAAKSKTTILFINQIRNKIGVMWGSPETTPGGLAMKFYASIRFKVSKKDKIQESKDSPVIGHNVKVDIIKTKVSQPYLNTTFNLMYAYGIDLVYDTLNAGLVSGVITKSGNTYMHGDTKLALGHEAVLEYLKTEPVVHDAIRDDVQAKINGMTGSVLKSVTAEMSETKKKKK